MRPIKANSHCADHVTPQTFIFPFSMFNWQKQGLTDANTDRVNTLIDKTQ